MDFALHEHVDALDSVNKWLDAIVIDKRPNGDIQLTYPDFSRKYDEWIPAHDVDRRVIK